MLDTKFWCVSDKIGNSYRLSFKEFLREGTGIVEHKYEADVLYSNGFWNVKETETFEKSTII